MFHPKTQCEALVHPNCLTLKHTLSKILTRFDQSWIKPQISPSLFLIKNDRRVELFEVIKSFELKRIPCISITFLTPTLAGGYLLLTF